MISTVKGITRPYRSKLKRLYQVLFSDNPTNYGKLSYSQEGEDMILARIFEAQINGFYVDVGAHHPQSLSNTYYFYLQGWRGINIEASPNSMTIFNKVRARDINLEVAISDISELLTYYTFNESAINGFCKPLVDELSKNERFEIIAETPIQTYTLSQILDNYLPNNQVIDFLNIDVEGLDYQVLKSNDWKKYRPKIVLVESLQPSSICKLDDQFDLKIKFMQEQDYQLYCRTVDTLFFKENQTEFY
jgi:FkbM family methyltransferase